MKRPAHTQRTPTGEQYLAPWASALMDTTTPLRAPADAPERPLPLFTQDEDARSDAQRQTSLIP